MSVIERFMSFLKTRSTEDFVESMITCFAAPVIQGIKCAKLLNLSRNGQNMRRAWDAVGNDLLARTGMHAREIASSHCSLLLLLYRQEALVRALSHEQTRNILAAFGYERNVDPAESLEPFLDILVRRFRTGCPHEIGIFLGYPLEDVLGFIAHDGRDAKLTGYWKVYGDEISAMQAFRAYREAEAQSALHMLAQAGLALPAT